MKKRILSTFLALAMCLSLLPTAAFAEGGTPGTTGVNYLYYNESTGEMVTKTKADGEYTTVTSSTGDTSWSGWYVVEGKGVKIEGTVTLTGETHLILCDGADLTVTDGITDEMTNGRNLTIYGQSESADAGKLTANADDKDAGIFVGGSNTLTINGGVVNAKEQIYKDSQGIYANALNIHGGSVTGTGNAYGIYALSLTTTGGTVSGYSTSGIDIEGYTITAISGGEFNGVVDANTIWKKNVITGGAFNQKLTISGTDPYGSDCYITDLLADDYICQSTADITGGKQKDEYYTLSELANVKTLFSARVVKCPHTDPNAKGECSYCLKAFVASLTSGETVSYYMELGDAVSKAGTDDTMTLLVNGAGMFSNKSKEFTFDLNGKNLSILFVTDKAITVKDSEGGGKIETLHVQNGVKIIDLLENGYGFKDKDGKWYDNKLYNTTGKNTVYGAEVKLIPIDSVSITAEDSYPYGEIELTANVTQQEGVTGAKTYEWTPVGTTGNDKTSATADGSDLMVDAGSSYTYQLTVTVDGYSVDSDNTVSFSVVKATPKVSTPLTATVTYGDAVKGTDIHGEMKAGGRSVPGTFTWKDVSTYGNATNGTERMLKATFTPDDDKNYNSVDDLNVSVTVNKAASTYTAPTANTLTYNGEPQELITAGSSTDGTMRYKLDNGAWSTAIPKAANAGNYTVSYKVVGDANHADSTEASVTVTIARKAVTPTVTVTQSSMVYDGTAKTPSVTVKDGETTIPTGEYEVAYSNNTNAGKATVTVTDKTGGNYAIVEAGTTFDIGKAKLPAPAFGTISESGKKLSDVTVNKDGKADTFSWDKGNDTEVKRGKSYAWTLTPKDAVNYDTLTGSYTPWPAPSSSGGGSSSNTTSTTVKNPDGSTTTTVTDKKTGTVTETTTTPNGTTSTTVTDKNGNSTTTVSVSKKDAQSGETVTLPVDEVTAAGKSEDATEITVEVPSGGATIEVPVKNPTAGTVIVIVDKDSNETVVPTTKQTENGVSVTLTEDATIKVIENSKDFSDVKDSDYFNKAVDWASSRGITGGNSATTFGSHDSCTRAQLVTFLWRVAGQPEAVNESGMSDVATNSYYTDAVAWAFENGIVGGYDNGLFGSEDTITREQMATILYRFAQKTGMDTTQGGMAVREFGDFENISDYAVTAIQWAVNAGVMQGYDGNLMPDQSCTRAQIVTMLYRLLGK